MKTTPTLPVAVIGAGPTGLAAAAQLHSRGILHGDLYAHNILWNPRGDCLLGDFGAASFYPESASRSFESIEVRAFGHLLGELLARVVPEKNDESAIEELLANLHTDLNVILVCDIDKGHPVKLRRVVTNHSKKGTVDFLESMVPSLNGETEGALFDHSAETLFTDA